MLRLFRQQREQRKLPNSLRIQTEQRSCQYCDDLAQLARVHKISIPAPTTPNVTVNLDVMQHTIYGKPIKIEVMLDAGDMMLRLFRIANGSARTAFSAYLTRWISIFDRPIFTIIDRGSNLTNKYSIWHLSSIYSIHSCAYSN